MKKLYSESKELLIMIVALSAVSVGSFILLVVMLLAIVPVLIVEALQRFTQWFQSRNQTM